ncbi:MAG: NfuA family Fe-S biogenesis protein [Aquimonas sp.]|nr:NfuA family Fe-S biogenesis protein [Aquimonas sp.]
MLQISSSAQQYFDHLIRQQGGDIVGIRLSAVRPGTPSADARLEFCEQVDLKGDEWALECEGFTLYVDAAGAEYFTDAEIDFEQNATGGQLTVRAPRIKGVPPGASASLVERVQHVIDTEINPGVASHGGRVTLEQITAEGVVVLRFGGGCQGCRQVDVTLKHGVEKTLLQRVPEITAVRDATDHAKGETPYFA